MRVREVRLVSVCCQWRGKKGVDVAGQVGGGMVLGGHISVNQFVQTAMSRG